jgi:Kef-type K+ transport system membrane component KefB
MERIGQAAVLGELLAGVIIGPGVLGLVHESPALHVLAELTIRAEWVRTGGPWRACWTG